ncbi:MAG: DUF4251 domain-containing protein [Bacteroidales bacterium]
MKRLNKYIWSLLLLAGFFGVSTALSGQEAQMTARERRETRKAVMEANFKAIDTVLNTRSFVLEANYLENRFGYRVPVTSNVNFIKIDSLTGVLQTGSNSRIGYNGIGGVTAEGSIGNWTVVKNVKNMTYTVRFNLITNIGIYDVLMQISADNHATATITGLWPGRLTYDGYLVAPYNARIFKGQNTI